MDVAKNAHLSDHCAGARKKLSWFNGEWTRKTPPKVPSNEKLREKADIEKWRGKLMLTLLHSDDLCVWSLNELISWKSVIYWLSQEIFRNFQWLWNELLHNCVKFFFMLGPESGLVNFMISFWKLLWTLNKVDVYTLAWRSPNLPFMKW